MIQNIPSHSGVWKKSDHSETPKSADPAPTYPPHVVVPPGLYAIPASDTPPAREPSIPSKNPSPKSPPVVDGDDPARHTHVHGSVLVLLVVVDDVVVEDDGIQTGD